jgi:hypothetical protein
LSSRQSTPVFITVAGRQGDVSDDGRVRRVRARHDPGAGESGLERDRAQGKTLGRPTISAAASRKALKKGNRGIRKIATTLGVSTVQRIKAEMSAPS